MINCGQFNVSQFNLDDYIVKTIYSYLNITLIYFENSKKWNNSIRAIIIKKINTNKFISTILFSI